MGFPAVIWGGIWVAGAIGARMAARQVARRVLQAAARRATSQAAQQAMATAIAAGTLSPEDLTGIDEEYSNADDRAHAVAREMAAACAANPRECAECPANQGTAVPRSWNMSPRAREYQQFVSGFPQNVEWNYNGVDFDGFWRPICTLIEAKDRYSQFLDVEITGGGIFSSPSIGRIRPKTFWQNGFNSIVVEAQRQSSAAVPKPPVMLQWHCSQIAVTMFLGTEFAREGIDIIPQYTPHPNPDITDPQGRYIP